MVEREGPADLFICGYHTPGPPSLPWGPSQQGFRDRSALSGPISNSLQFQATDGEAPEGFGFDDLHPEADAEEERTRRILARFFLSLQEGFNEGDVQQIVSLPSGSPQQTRAILEAIGQTPERFSPVLAQSYRVVLTGVAGSTLRTTPLGPLTSREGGFSLGLNLVNADASRWALEESSSLITSISDETRQVIQRLINESFERGISPQRLATMVQQHVGLTPQASRALSRFEEDLRSRGVIEESIQYQVADYSNRLLTSRTETIARTEIMRSSNMGKQILWERAIEEGYLNPASWSREWIVARDDRLCSLCAPMQGMRVPLTGEFQGVNSRIVVRTPPLHPRCRCTMVLVENTP